MGRTDRTIYLLLAGLAGIYVVLRAVLVPPVHDEARAFHLFVLSGDFVPFVAKVDAANHFTASALAQVSYFLFGDHMIGMRIWSVLAFVLYAWYVWRMGSWVRWDVVRWCTWAALLFTPFLIDFFSLFRGYGAALAFWTMALHHFVLFADSSRKRDLLIALLGAALAAWSILSLLLVWCALLGVLAVLIVRKNGPGAFWAWWVTAGLLPFGLAVGYAPRLQMDGQLYVGSVRDYLRGTLMSLCGVVLGSDSAAWFIVFALALLLLTALFWKPVSVPHTGRTFLAVVGILLILDATGHTASGLLFGTLRPITRGALYLAPMIICLLALSIDALANRKAAWRWSALVLLFLPLRTWATANVDHTACWPEQAIPPSFFKLVGEEQLRSGRLLTISAHPFMTAVWDVGAREYGGKFNTANSEGFPRTDSDLLLMDTVSFTAPPGVFRTIARAPSGRNNLMERIRPVHGTRIVDTVFSSAMSSKEFRDLWHGDVTRWRGRSLLLEADLEITSRRGTLATRIFSTLWDEERNVVYDVGFDVDHQRGSTSKGPFHLAVVLPIDAVFAKDVAFGLWDPQWHPFALDSAHIRIHVLE